MKIKKMGEKLFVKLEIGDEIGESLKKACIEHQVRAGSVSGIGACDVVELGYFEPEGKDYRVEKVEGDFELLNLKGNISMLKGKSGEVEPFAHLHIMLGKEDYSIIGGHMVSARISITGEIVVDIADGEIVRERDEEKGVNLWRL
jgi:uncharacterized protein